MTCKRTSFCIMVLGKANMFGRTTFCKSMHKELQFCSFNHSMLDPLEEPKHSVPNIYASDLAPCQNGFHGNWIWQLHHNGFGLITLSSFILLSTFLATLNFIDGVHVSSRQCNAYIYIYIYIYICLKSNTRISLKQSTFSEVEIG